MDGSDLRSAGDAFLAELREGGFGPAPADGWGHERVAAHIATNDRLLAEVTRALLGDESPSYDNASAIDETVLDDFVARTPDLGLAVEASAKRLCSLVDELSDAHAACEVPVRIRDGGELVVDGPTPWGRLLGVHANLHLPGHTEQLRALRG